jgi:2-polyprenyl-6-methoxyphenol hydroxylase-like FAD-dependent oxidoreductase
MKNDSRTQVLVVGAGPVGLIAALRLAHQGVAVRIVDRLRSELSRSFPVVLHPQSLRILSSLGATAALFWRGRPIAQLAIHTEQQRRVVLDLPRAANISPGAMTLPQDVLRQALLNALGLRGIFVEWGVEVTALAQGEHSVDVSLRSCDPLDELDGAAAARAGETQRLQADFVIGADGYDSTVRRLLQLELEPCGPLESYAFFDAVASPLAEAQLALDDELASAVYPLHDGRLRFSYQLQRGLHELPELEQLRRLTAARLPWYRGTIEACEWSGVAEFRPALARHFGQGRVWLAGDAAHTSSPLGVQSLNVGLDEASELGLRIADALRRPGQPSFGQAYEARRMAQWRRLLGAELQPESARKLPAWLAQELPRLVRALPASERDLEQLIEQLCVGSTVEQGAQHA